MRLSRVQLSNYRNFHRLDLSLGPGASVFIGGNAQGKTNLLESVYLLATMKELRAESEAQVIRREAAGDPIPAARVVGEGETAAGPLKVEVAVIGREGSNGLIAGKTVRINGVPKRLSDAVGRLTAVLFTAADIDLISGAPSARRRYIDITLSQVDGRYVVARSRLERVIAQRNHLLKRMREGLARAEELSFWDAELARDGGYVFAVRSAALSELASLAAEAHASLAPAEELRVEYRPRLDGETAESLRDAEGAAAAYAAALRRGVSRDVAAGMTLQGPHRDDIAFSLDGEPSAGFASRAQQRTIALALRLAEARLLDDILSEMDAARGRSVIEAVSAYDQLLITATDLERFPDGFLNRAAVFRVTAGAVSVAASQPIASRGTAES